MSLAAENRLSKNYELPLGGVNFDDFMASMWMAQIKPLTAFCDRRGRRLGTFSTRDSPVLHVFRRILASLYGV